MEQEAVVSPRKKARGLKPSGKDKQQIYVVRMANLREIIRKWFKGRTQECAEKVGTTNSYIWQLVKGKPMGADSARKIEQGLGLEEGTLDRKPGEAFGYKQTVTVQLREAGKTMPIMLVPIISLQDAVGTKERRKQAMVQAKQVVPIPHAPDGAIGVEVPNNVLCPRLCAGEIAVVDPEQTAPLVNNAVYLIDWHTPAGERLEPLFRIAHRRDGGQHTFEVPPQRQREMRQLKRNGPRHTRTIEDPIPMDEVTVAGIVIGAWRPMAVAHAAR